MTVRIDVEEIIKLQARRREINALDLKDITFYRDGKPVEIPDEAIEEWRFVGLSNIDFVGEVILEEGRIRLMVGKAVNGE
jgi:hypothetical protein